MFVGYDQTRRARSRRSAVGRVLSERPHDQHLGNIVLHVTRPEWLGTVLAIATGSPSHVVQLQELAERNGLALTSEGMRRGTKVVPTPDERDVYRLLALPFIEPELREGEHEIRLAKAKKLPRLVQDGDLRGIIHAHTDRSDGVHTLEQMAEAERKTGLRRTARKFGTLSQALPLLPANRAKRGSGKSVERTDGWQGGFFS